MNEKNTLTTPYLNCVYWKIQCVMDDNVVGWRHGSLPHVLRHEEEVVPVPLGDRVIEDCARRRIVQFLPNLVEDPRVDSFLNHDEAEARVVFLPNVVETVLELLGLVRGGERQLAVTDTVPEDHDLVGPDVVHLVVLLQCLDEGNLQTVHEFLSWSLEHGGAEPSAHGHVGAADDSGDARASSGRVVEHVYSKNHDVSNFSWNLASP